MFDIQLFNIRKTCFILPNFYYFFRKSKMLTETYRKLVGKLKYSFRAYIVYIVIFVIFVSYE